MKKLIAIIGLAAALLLSTNLGCKTPSLEPGGAYALTNELGQVIYNDIGLAMADATYKFTYESTLALLRFERDNRREIWAISPEVKRQLDKLRPKIVSVNHEWAVARSEYRLNPTEAGVTRLQSILKQIQQLLSVIESQLEPVNNKLINVSPNS